MPSSYRNCFPRAWLIPWSVTKNTMVLCKCPVFLEPSENAADFDVGIANRIKIPSPILANHRMVGIVRR